jgi:DNA-binding response OmpR family regulator
MLSARGQKQDLAEGRSAGADAYMVKPFSPQELIVLINRFVETPATGECGSDGMTSS